MEEDVGGTAVVDDPSPVAGTVAPADLAVVELVALGMPPVVVDPVVVEDDESGSEPTVVEVVATPDGLDTSDKATPPLAAATADGQMVRPRGGGSSGTASDHSVTTSADPGHTTRPAIDRGRRTA